MTAKTTPKKRAMEKMIIDADEVPEHIREYGIPVTVKCCARNHREGSTAAYYCSKKFRERVLASMKNFRTVLILDTGEGSSAEVGGTD